MGKEIIWRRRKGVQKASNPSIPPEGISFGPGIPSPMPLPQHRYLVRQLL